MGSDRACPLACYDGDCDSCGLAIKPRDDTNHFRRYVEDNGNLLWVSHSGGSGRPVEAERPVMWRALTARTRLLLGLGVVALAITVYGFGFLKGSHSAEVRLQKELNQALNEQAKHLRAMHRQQITALEAKSRREQVARQINALPRPAGPLCDAGGEWLQSISDGLRSANDLASPD